MLHVVEKVVQDQRDLLWEVDQVVGAALGGLDHEAVQVLADVVPDAHHVHRGVFHLEEGQPPLVVAQLLRQVRILAVRQHEHVDVLGIAFALEVDVHLLKGRAEGLAHVRVASGLRERLVAELHHLVARGEAGQGHQHLHLVIERERAKLAGQPKLRKRGHKVQDRLLHCLKRAPAALAHGPADVEHTVDAQLLGRLALHAHRHRHGIALPTCGHHRVHDVRVELHVLVSLRGAAATLIAIYLKKREKVKRHVRIYSSAMKRSASSTSRKVVPDTITRHTLGETQPSSAKGPRRTSMGSVCPVRHMGHRTL